MSAAPYWTYNLIPLGAPSTDPATLAHLELYLKSDSSDVVGLADGAAVPSWADQSGNGRNCIQNTAGSRPLYRVNASPNNIGLIGLDAHPFTGGAELDSNTAMSLTTARGYTLYVYYVRTAIDTANGDQPVLFEMLDGLGGFVQMEDSGGGIIIPNDTVAHLDWRIQGAMSTSERDCGRVTSGAHVFSLALPPGGTGGNARQDGASIGPTGTWSLGAVTNYLLGNTSNANATSRLRVGAIVLYTDNHDTPTRSRVEQFLRNHWG